MRRRGGGGGGGGPEDGQRLRNESGCCVRQVLSEIPIPTPANIPLLLVWVSNRVKQL